MRARPFDCVGHRIPRNASARQPGIGQWPIQRDRQILRGGDDRKQERYQRERDEAFSDRPFEGRPGVDR